MIEKIRRFMFGRYGVDKLGKFIIIISAIIMVLSAFVMKKALYSLSLALLLLCIYRMMSKDHNRRSKENYIYLKYTSNIYGFFRKGKYDFEQRKIYHIFKCPSCKQKVRVPKGKGNITITCPKCKAEFKKKS